MDMGEVELLLKDSDAMADAHREVVFTMVRNEIARKVVQIFSLERLKAEDLWIAESLLELIVRNFYCFFSSCILYQTTLFFFCETVKQQEIFSHCIAGFLFRKNRFRSNTRIRPLCLHPCQKNINNDTEGKNKD